MKMSRYQFKKIIDAYYAQSPPTKFVLAVDFDHTLCYSSYPLCGDETPIAAFIRSVQDMDVIIIISTCREVKSAELAKEWLKEHNIRWNYFNENDPARIEIYKDCRKIYCDMLIDDTAYCFNMNDFE